MKSNTSTRTSKLCQCVRAPLRLLRRVGDLYVKALSHFSARMHHGAVMGYPAGLLYPAHNSFVARPNEDQALRRLVLYSRKKVQEEKNNPVPRQTRTRGFPKCFTVGIARIDEDRPCNFPEDFKVNLDRVLCQRRWSAVTRKGW